MKTLAVVFLLIAAQPLLAITSVVILPFSNKSDQQKIYWLGEGFAESLSEEVILHNAYVIQRAERKAAYDDLRLPYTGDLSRATMLKIGGKLSADYVVFGTYNLKGPDLIVQVKVIRISTSELSGPVSIQGPLDQLYRIQNSVRDGLNKYFRSKGLLPLEQKAMENQMVSLHAYELYIKGLLEVSDSEKILFFQRALASQSDYTQAAYRLGVALFRMQRFKESNEALNKIQARGAFVAETEFLKGLNSYFAQDYEKAYRTWYGMLKTTPTAEVCNNIGLALIMKNDLRNAELQFFRAINVDPINEDIRFNLAALYVQKSNIDSAIMHFREVIASRPNDFQSLYLLAKELEQKKDPSALKVMEYFREKLPADQRGKFPEQLTSLWQLLRPSLSFLSREEREYFNVPKQKTLKDRAAYVRTYQVNAKNNLEQNDPANAVLEIRKGLGLAPLDWYLHYLWGLALEKQEQPSEAVAELQFSVWCKANVDSHILLAEIYSEHEKYADAKKHVQQILTIDPKNKRAQEIWNKIWDKQ